MSDIPEYVCHRHRHYGTCANTLHIAVGEMNEAVLTAIEEHVLTAEAIEKVVTLTERDDAADQQMALARERKSLDKKIDRLVAAVAEAGDISALAAKLRELEARRTAIDNQLRALRPLPRLPQDVIENRLAEWRRMMRGSTTQGRSVLQRMLVGRIVFTPLGEGYTFEAQTRFDRLFAGCVVPQSVWARPSKTGLHLQPSDVYYQGEDDADYGRLLARVYGKGVSSPTGFEPVFWP